MSPCFFLAAANRLSVVIKKILTVLFGLVFGLVIAEVLVRLVKPAPTVYGISVTSDNGDHALSLNRDLIYVPKPNTGEFNGKGYRGREYPFERTPGKKRIVLIGDSVLEGLGVTESERFSEILQRRAGTSVEIINLGVRGYNLAQEFAYLKEAGLRYKPDLVAFCTTFNDVEIESGEIQWLSKLLEKQQTDAFFKSYYRDRTRRRERLMKSHLFRWVFLLTSGRKSKESGGDKDFINTIYYRLGETDINGILDGFLALAAEHGFIPAFVFLPLPAETKSADLESIREFVRKKDIASIDIFEEVREGRAGAESESLFLDICHLTPYGHLVVADALKAGLLPLLR